MTELENKYPRLFFKHKRKTIANPDGAIAHDGDCDIYNVHLQICTCGLHHSLAIITNGDAEEIYPKYIEELEGKGKVHTLMQVYEEGNLWEACELCKGKGGVAMTPCEQCEGKGVVPFKMPEPPTDEEMEEMMKQMREKFGNN